MAETNGLLNRRAVNIRTGGSNPPLSAICTFREIVRSCLGALRNAPPREKMYSKEIKGGGGKKLESESEGGQKFLPPNPLPLCPPERLDFKVQNSDFAQRMFEHQSKTTAIWYIPGT